MKVPPDKQPAPQAYLRAGLPRPNGADDRKYLPSRPVVSQDNQPVVADLAGEQPQQEQATTMIGEDGLPAAVLWTRSHQYLTRPAPDRWTHFEDIEDVTRHPSGAVQFTLSEEVKRRLPTNQSAPPDLASCRVVTFDSSVLRAGLEPQLFAAKDALFISMALVIDLAATPCEWSSNGARGTKYGQWTLTQPVPIDDYVIRVYQLLLGDRDNTGNQFHREDPMDRTDLLIAATALLYSAPVYTTDPDAYRGIRNGLKTIEYGPIRNKNA